MSAYMTLRTPMVDEECLVEALVATGLGRAQIKVSPTPLTLQGYVRGRSAHILIPKGVTGDSYNDIGFLRTATGFTAVLSDDSSAFGRTWLRAVQDQYEARWSAKVERLAEAERQRLEREREQLVEAQTQAVRQRARAMGYQIKETRVGDTVRLALVKRTY